MFRRALTGLLASLLVPSIALAHAAIQRPPARNPADSSIKRGPCGPYAPGSGVRTQLIAGSQFTIEFDETINHPGYFQVFFSEVADTNFVLIEDQIPHSNAAPSPTMANPRHYTHPITIPNTPCASCSLQFIQVMTDRNPPTLYFSCADIEIVAPGGADGGVVADDAAVPADGGVVSPDALPAQMDAAPSGDPDAAAPVVNDDAAAVVPAPDAAAVIVHDDAAVAGGTPDAATAMLPTRQSVGGGCSAVGPSAMSPVLLLAFAALALRRWRN